MGWLVSSCGFGEWRDLARSEILQDWVWDCSSCDVCNNLHEQVAVSSLLTKIVPMLSTHAKWSGITESRHSSECAWGPDQQLPPKRDLTQWSGQELQDPTLDLL